MSMKQRLGSMGPIMPGLKHRFSLAVASFWDRPPDQRCWAIALALFFAIGMPMEFLSIRGFWGSYVIDIVGPALVYIYIRGLHARDQPTEWGKFFFPEFAMVTVALICFLAELAQYFELYNKVYDPYDFAAYVSLLLPCYAVDRWRLSSTTATASDGSLTKRFRRTAGPS